MAQASDHRTLTCRCIATSCSRTEPGRNLEPLAPIAYFAQVRVDAEAGTVVWPNGADMAPEPLYAEARRHPVRAA